VNGRLAVTRALGDMDFKDLGKDPAKQVCQHREPLPIRFPSSRSAVGFALAGPPSPLAWRLHCTPRSTALLLCVRALCAVRGLVETKLRCSGVPQVVMAVPEVHSRELTSGSEFLILACDGIWEVLSDQEVRLAASPGRVRSRTCPMMADGRLRPSRVLAAELAGLLRHGIETRCWSMPCCELMVCSGF